MEKTKNRMFKNYILLFLILVLVAILVVPIEWIANHVPKGIVGLIIFMGYLLFIYVVFRSLIIKVGNELIATEQEMKLRKLKYQNKKYHNIKKNDFPKDIIEKLINKEYQFSEKSFEQDGNTFFVKLLTKTYKESFMKIPDYIVLAFIMNFKNLTDISGIIEMIGKEISNSLSQQNERVFLRSSICFISEKLDVETIEYCLSNFMDDFSVYMPVACEIKTGKMYYLKGKKGVSKKYCKQVELIEEIFEKYL